jgi:hypothetical protein
VAFGLKAEYKLKVLQKQSAEENIRITEEVREVFFGHLMSVEGRGRNFKRMKP